MRRPEIHISHIYNEYDREIPAISKESRVYNDEGWHIQTNNEHCEGVASLSATFASEFGMSEWGRMLGLLHDRGKETGSFQSYIRRSSGYDPEALSDSGHAHSYIGGVLAHKIPLDQLFWLSNPIVSHHSGLHNLDELELILSRPIPEEVSKTIPEISLPLPDFKMKPEDASHISRMLFSCLVDADWLDTEKFMQKEKAEIRGRYSTLTDLRQMLLNYRETLSHLQDTPINTLRNDIQKRCETAAGLQPGFFELTVPTGGGKTIASVIWALEHAIRFNKKRIIIAIPFTSIIVQTAGILKKIFGEDNVIEHHSALNEKEDNERSILACENWDAPIIVTTNVQLFESMFSNRRSACRKLHSIVNSVVILDEVQTLPLPFLQPIVNGMKTYARLFHTSFLLCTASQPILDGKREGCNGALFEGIERKEIRQIISSDLKLHDRLRRVTLTFEDKKTDYSTLAQSLARHKRVLCIVNSRRHALEIYNELIRLDNDTPTFHLSRSMCSAHILDTIDEIKNILSNPCGNVRVISTQLIEAGVDIDFPVVFRQLTGLDSILQAAGRCNREGKLKEGKTIVFTFSEDHEKGMLRMGADAMKDLISLYPDADWFSADIMQKYYERLYFKTPHFDKENIGQLLDKPKSCQFEEASKKFSLITEGGINIIVNFGNSEKLIEKLKFSGSSRKISRQLGRLSVNVSQRKFNEFLKAGLIEEPSPGFYFIPLKTQYDPSIGLKGNNDYLEQSYII